MEAAVLHKTNQPLVLEEVPDPIPRGPEVLVRVKSAGFVTQMFTFGRGIMVL